MTKDRDYKMITKPTPATFNTKLARFGAVAAVIQTGPCDDKISFANPKAVELIGEDIHSFAFKSFSQESVEIPKVLIIMLIR